MESRTCTVIYNISTTTFLGQNRSRQESVGIYNNRFIDYRQDMPIDSIVRTLRKFGSSYLLVVNYLKNIKIWFFPKMCHSGTLQFSYAAVAKFDKKTLESKLCYFPICITLFVVVSPFLLKLEKKIATRLSKTKI